jgi:hypothetical protein
MTAGTTRLGRVLVLGGGLLLLGAVLLPTVLAPRLETVPADPDVTTTLLATGAQVLDAETQSTVTRDLTLTSSTSGYTATGGPPGGVVQWQTNATITSDEGVIRSQTWEVGAFDARTGRASGCCEGFRITAAGAAEPVTRAGQVLKFPFGTEPADHEVWDPALGESVTATYVGETAVDGVRAFEFRSVVPPTDLGPTTVPASIMGIASVHDLQVRQVYEGERTVWVEPNTGGLLDVRQRVRQTLETGDTVVVALDATFQFSDESRVDAVDQLRQGVHLGRMRGVYPIALGSVGLILLGGVLLRRRRGDVR